jgi:uncharacterized protein YceH (UPF0502 family)
MEPSPVEIRVLGALIEKQRTTPEQYPLTLNALRLACNQATNRDPVVDYDEAAIKDALQRLRQRGWTRFASGHGSRAAKYRHLLDQALGLGRDEIALMCVLMLRGPQTPGELKQRTDRLHGFESLAQVEETLDRLIERELVVRLGRRPGQKEDRFAQALGGGETEEPDSKPWPVEPAVAADPVAEERETGVVAEAEPRGAAHADGAEEALDVLAERVGAIERSLAELRSEVSALRRDLGD